MGGRPKQTFHQGRHTDGQEAHEKMLNITNYQRDANQNYNELQIQLLWKTVQRFLKKLKLELPYDPAMPLLGIYPEKTIIQKDTCTTMFIAALFTIARS